jgi:hypothetical protein
MAAFRAYSHNRPIPCLTRAGFKTGFPNCAKKRFVFAKVKSLPLEMSEIIARSFIIQQIRVISV